MLPAKDYPRACGGTMSGVDDCRVVVGLSPRMRGNPDEITAGIFSQGTIPAHAGEPKEVNALAMPVSDYPRACGGTSSI